MEFHEVESAKDKDLSSTKQFAIRIPHCIEDQALWGKIRVKCSDMYGEGVFLDVEKFNSRRRHEAHFEIEKDFITIYTPHFTDHLRTLCDYLYCTDLVQVFLYGSLGPTWQLQNQLLWRSSHSCAVDFTSLSTSKR